MVNLGPLQAGVTITLNREDMMAAVEYWLNETYLKKPAIVKDIRSARQGASGYEIDVIPKEISEEIHPDDRR